MAELTKHIVHSGQGTSDAMIVFAPGAAPAHVAHQLRRLMTADEFDDLDLSVPDEGAVALTMRRALPDGDLENASPTALAAACSAAFKFYVPEKHRGQDYMTQLQADIEAVYVVSRCKRPMTRPERKVYYERAFDQTTRPMTEDEQEAHAKRQANKAKAEAARAKAAKAVADRRLALFRKVNDGNATEDDIVEFNALLGG